MTENIFSSEPCMLNQPQSTAELQLNSHSSIFSAADFVNQAQINLLPFTAQTKISQPQTFDGTSDTSKLPKAEPLDQTSDIKLEPSHDKSISPNPLIAKRTPTPPVQLKPPPNPRPFSNRRHFKPFSSNKTVVPASHESDTESATPKVDQTLGKAANDPSLTVGSGINLIAESLIAVYNDVFQSTVNTKNIKHSVNHHIVTTGPPVKSRVRRLSSEMLRFVKEKIGQLLKNILVPSSSFYASPIHIREVLDGRRL